DAPPRAAVEDRGDDRRTSAAPALRTARVALDPAVPAGSEAAVLGGWPLIAADEFDAPVLDPASWFPYTGGAAGGNGSRSEDSLSVADGVLTVTARGLQSGGAAWSPDQTYGRWEVRARTEAGAGYRPAVLLWPDAEDWPEGGEIDFLDTPDPGRTETNFVVHFGKQNSQVGSTVVGDFTEWHTYAVEWTPEHIAGFIDGQEVFRTTDPAHIPTRPMHLVVQQDVGPSADGWTPALDGSTPPEVRMKIDWVRVYGL
ncbi:MAG TPA: glycoside hydrolase family 16 protein, partial [Pseudonocardia sp.]|nr:glycoside hydrolase family 16 protein [Pseudonocardia sp.]